jgi:hypothetical protein
LIGNEGIKNNKRLLDFIFTPYLPYEALLKLNLQDIRRICQNNALSIKFLKSERMTSKPRENSTFILFLKASIHHPDHSTLAL